MVVSSIPPCVTFKMPLVRKAMGSHLMNPTSLEKYSEPCLWFLLRSKSSMRRSFLCRALVAPTVIVLFTNVVDFKRHITMRFLLNSLLFSQEIREIIPTPLRLVKSNRISTHLHPFQVSLPNPQALSHKSSFIPKTCNLWNFLPSAIFRI